MSRQRGRTLAVLLCASSILAGPMLADTNAEFADTAARVHVLAEQLQLGIYLMKSTLVTENRVDIRLAASRVAELLQPETGTGAAQDPTESLGMVAAAEALAASQDLSDYLDPASFGLFKTAMRSAHRFLGLALDEVLVVSSIASTGKALEDHRERAYSYLVAALGAAGSFFWLDGVALAMTLVPATVTWVSPGESIQDAVDRVTANGHVYIEPGIYSESVTISASVRVARSPLTSGSVEIRSPDARPAIDVAAGETPFDVTLVGLTLSGGVETVSVAGRSTVALDTCSILSSRSTGLRVSGAAQVRLEGCLVANHPNYGIVADGYSVLSLFRSSVRRNGIDGQRSVYPVPTAGIFVLGHAQAVVTTDDVYFNPPESYVEQNRGAGILVAEHGAIRVNQSYIRENSDDGILLLDACTLFVGHSFISGNGGFGIRAYGSTECATSASNGYAERQFVGSLDGGRNEITDTGDAHPNALGTICPKRFDDWLRAIG